MSIYPFIFAWLMKCPRYVVRPMTSRRSHFPRRGGLLCRGRASPQIALPRAKCTSRKVQNGSEKAPSQEAYLMLYSLGGFSLCKRREHILSIVYRRYRRVAFLECDVGQSEFTPGGMVALNVVSSPVFGTFTKKLLMHETKRTPQDPPLLTSAYRIELITSVRHHRNTYRLTISKLSRI